MTTGRINQVDIFKKILEIEPTISNVNASVPSTHSPEYSKAANFTDTSLLSFVDPSRSLCQEKPTRSKAISLCTTALKINFHQIISTTQHPILAPMHQPNFHSDSSRSESTASKQDTTVQNRPSNQKSLTSIHQAAALNERHSLPPHATISHRSQQF